MNELERVFNAMQKAKHWVDEANCRDMDTNLFFPEDGMVVSKFVKELCGTCPVMEDCLWYANESSTDHGVFAGMSVKRRRDWRRKNKVILGMSKQEWESRNRGYLRTPRTEWSTL
jgi:WhiB family redox-sensing transcriptional regulator